ncbi:MAG: hypothetical protein RRB13_10640 [bacterium]|nr:hypothetical protein [bacterium]
MNLLIICEENASRSQMAQAVMERLVPEAEIVSAGLKPAGSIHPLAIRAAFEAGYSLLGQRPKSLDSLAGQAFDMVLSLCESPEVTLPVSLQNKVQFSLNLPDPARAQGSLDQQTQSFCRCFEEIQLGCELIFSRQVLAQRECRV